MKAVMDHIALNVEDAEAMARFYSEVVGLPPERLDAFRTGQVMFPSVRISADTIIDLFPKAMWGKEAKGLRGQGHLNHFCLAASQREWTAVRTRLEAHSVPIETGPVPRWGAHGTGISIYFRDPEGNLVEIRYYERVRNGSQCLLGS